MKDALLGGYSGTITMEFEPSSGARLRRMLKASKREFESSPLDQAYETTESKSALYDCGVRDGSRTSCLDLSDVLYNVKQHGLGLGTVIQESNSHIVLRIQRCRECERQAPGCGCNYIAGFLCGALRAMGKPATISVHEVSCGESNSASCVFLASW